MDSKALNLFYQDNGSKKVFLKSQFIRLIRNKIIDPNTNAILANGFDFYDSSVGEYVKIPCDDSNWSEFDTFDKGFKYDVLSFPFTLKLHNNWFYSINSYDEFKCILKLMIEFRTKTIKKGWAIKYGLEYDNIEYDVLENLEEYELINWKDPRANATHCLDEIKESDLL